MKTDSYLCCRATLDTVFRSTYELKASKISVWLKSYRFWENSLAIYFSDVAIKDNVIGKSRSVSMKYEAIKS